MPFHNITKNSPDTTSSGQNKQSTLLLFPGASAEEDTAIPSRTLAETIRALNPDIDPDAVQDALIVQTFGYSEKTMRARWSLSPHADLRRAMERHNRFLYTYFMLVEEGLRLYLEAMILNDTYMDIEAVTRQAAVVAYKNNANARVVANFLDGLVKHATFSLDDGAFVEDDEDDDSDEDDIGF